MTRKTFRHPVRPVHRPRDARQCRGQALRRRFDIAADGTLSHRRVWADGVGPDGICLDAEGCIWASSGSMINDCARIREGGEVLDRIELDGTEGMQEVVQARTGRILVADAPAPGVGWP